MKENKEEKKRQLFRYSDKELELIKNSFSENEDLLKSIRKVMLQMPLNAVDLALINELKRNSEVIALVRKTFLPELEADAPLHQIIDLWLTVDIKDKIPNEAFPHLKARDLLIRYLDQQLKELEGKEDRKIIFNQLIYDKDKLPNDNYAELTARNTIISHTEQMLNQLFVMAGQKDESIEDTAKRLAKNSTK